MGSTLLGADPSGVLEGRLELPDSDGAAGRLRLTLRPTGGRFPHEVLPVLGQLAATRASDTLELHAGPLRLAQFSAKDAWPSDLHALHRLAAALNVIQRHLQTLLRIPRGDLENAEARNILDIAEALSTSRARLRHRAYSLAIKPGALKEFLELVPQLGGALRVTYSDYPFELDGVTHGVPGLAVWAPRVTLANRNQLESELKSRREQVARLEAAGDEHYYLIRQSTELEQ